ncbi:MAG: ribose-5-phosphate isomerase RpiA [Halobacteriaceae archaeon]
MDDRQAAKRRAGAAAAEAATDGMVVGLGTGSTAAAAIRALGQRVDGGLDITGVPTSYQARVAAMEAGIPVQEIGTLARIDLAIDGADQVVGKTAIKGRGGAHTREKIVDTAADELLLVVDESKLADALTEAVPLAVVPAARSTAAAAVREHGGEPTLRAATSKDGPVVTDEGNLILDCAFGRIDAPAELAATLAAIPGVVEHGLFVELADKIYVGRPEGVSTVT